MKCCRGLRETEGLENGYVGEGLEDFHLAGFVTLLGVTCLQPRRANIPKISWPVFPRSVQFAQIIVVHQELGHIFLCTSVCRQHIVASVHVPC